MSGISHNKDMIIRRRKTTSSSTKSRQSIDDTGRHTTLTQADEDLSVSFDIRYLCIFN